MLDHDVEFLIYVYENVCRTYCTKILIYCFIFNIFNIQVNVQPTQWSDIGGLEEVKEALQQVPLHLF